MTEMVDQVEDAVGEMAIASGNDWQELMGKDLMMKVIDKSNSLEKEAEAIEPHDAVLINVEGWVAKDKNDESNMNEIFQNVQSWLIVVGDGDVLPAIEMGVRFMETGQTALIWSHSKYAMGPGTRTFLDGNKKPCTVPPHSNVMYKISIRQKVMDTSRLNPYFTIQKATTKKKIANDIYQNEWCTPPQTKDDPVCEQAMNRAIRLYSKSAKEMETLLQGTYFQTVEENHPQRLESRQLLLDCLNNVIAVHLKQKEYNKAKLASVQVLQVDPHNLKALLRAAKASLLDPASTLEEASVALSAAESDITYKNPEEEKELRRLKALYKKKQHEYKETSKSMFGNKLKSTSNSSSSSSKPVTLNSKDKNSIDEINIDESTEKSTSIGETRRDDKSTEGEDSNTPLNAVVEQSPSPGGDGFLRAHAVSAFVQIVIPLLIYLLYRFLQSDDEKFDHGSWKLSKIESGNSEP